MASIFLVWQSLVILMGPAPGSHTMGKIYPYFKPYMKILHLENYWAFFAPNPYQGEILRYIVQDQQGEYHVFKLNEELHRNAPSYFRYTTLYGKLTDAESPYTASMIQYLCRRHADLQPANITIMIGYQQFLKAGDYLQGIRPLSTDHMEVEYHEPMSCTAGAGQG
jgi:hypothetical protein